MKTFIDHVGERELSEALSEFEIEDKKIVQDYLNFLLDNELAFYCNSQEESKSFQDMDTFWDYPASITNAVIEIDNPDEIPAILKSISDLYIPCIQLVIQFDVQNLQKLEEQIRVFDKVNNKTLQILFCNKEDYSLEDLTKVSSSNPKIEFIIAFASKENKLQTRNHTTIIFSTQSKYGSHYCGIIDFEQFSINTSHYTESLAYNTCLNRKISIDVNGDIKNCPSMKESFGNIKDITLKEAIEKPGFKKYWNVTKDQITKCKDCEFRHVCTDCRAYVENPADMYSAPLKCGYDPYTCQWEEWSKNPLKQKAIDFYGMQNEG